MALSAGETFTGGQVRDTQSRSVIISETTNAALTAGDQFSGGFLRDPDGRLVICQDAAHAALSAGEQQSGGEVRDSIGRVVCAAETVNSAISAGSVFSGGWLRDSRGRRIIALDTLGSALSAGEQFTAGQVRDSVGRLVLAAESGGGGFNPASIAGLVGWWKADSIAQADLSAVASWTDSSAGANNATQATGGAQPTFRTNQINGLPAVSFNGSTHFLASAMSAATLPVMMFAVLQPTSFAVVHPIIGSAGATGFVWRTETTGLCSLVKADAVLLGSSSTPLTAAATVRIAASTAAAAQAFYKSGTADGTAATTVGGFGANTSLIGSSVDNDRWLGLIGELLFYNSVLSGTDRASVDAYLLGRWGV